MRKKILFYDKEVKLAYPQYAINLLKELENRGYEIFILYDRPKQNSKENIAGIHLNEIYCEFKSKRITSWDDIYNAVSLFKPDLYLSSMALFGFERELLEYIHSVGIIIFEIDTIASEILKYSKKYRFMSANRQFKNRIKRFIQAIGAQLKIEKMLPNRIFGIQLYPEEISFISDFISLKGSWFQNLLTKEKNKGYSTARFPITGSIQLDVLCNEILTKGNLFKKLDYDFNKKTILLLPSLAWLKNKKDDDFFNFILKYLMEKGEYNIAIQPHPAERVKNPDRFNHVKELVIHPLDFYPILQHADLVICPRSSVFFETAITKTPLFFASHHKNNIEMPVITDNYKIVTFVSTNNFEEKLEDVMSNREEYDFDNFIKDFCFSDDGNSFKRITCKIEEISQ